MESLLTQALGQADGKLRRLSRNHLFEVDDLRQSFAEGVIKALPSADPDKPTPVGAYLYQMGMYGVLHYMRNQANRSLTSTCPACGWHGTTYQRRCPKCHEITVGKERYVELDDTHHPFDNGISVPNELFQGTEFTEAEQRVLWLLTNSGPVDSGIWKDIAFTLGISRARVAQLKKRLAEKLEKVLMVEAN